MKWIGRLENIFCGFMMLTVTGILFVNVLLRYVFHSSTSWSDEFVRYGIVWLCFIGGACCMRVGAHVNVDILPHYLGKTGQTILFAIRSIVALGFIVILGKLGLDNVILNLQTGQTSPSLHIPMFYVYLAIPIGCLLMAIHQLELIVRVIRKRKSPDHLVKGQVAKW